MITYDDFKKIELRAAKILRAERIEGSDKLLRLDVDAGDETRQLVAGIGKAYDPADLVGMSIVIVSNLEPRSLMGHESKGMLLAARGEGEAPVLLSVIGNVAPGAPIG